MNLNPIKTNMTEVTFSLDGQRAQVLFSYKTPVAMRLLTPEGMEYHVTEQYWSRTTSKHINAWMPKEDRIEHPQEYFDNLLEATEGYTCLKCAGENKAEHGLYCRVVRS